MPRDTFYHIRPYGAAGQFACVKVDAAFEIETVYFLETDRGAVLCDCHAGSWSRACRHASLLETFQEQGMIGQRVLYSFGTRTFLRGGGHGASHDIRSVANQPASHRVVEKAGDKPASGSYWDFLLGVEAAGKAA
jgi:hypothetical protein